MSFFSKIFTKEYYLRKIWKVFPELTFTPAGNLLPQYTENFKNRLGQKLKLPSKYIP